MAIKYDVIVRKTDDSTTPAKITDVSMPIKAPAIKSIKDYIAANPAYSNPTWWFQYRLNQAIDAVLEQFPPTNVANAQKAAADSLTAAQTALDTAKAAAKSDVTGE